MAGKIMLLLLFFRQGVNSSSFPLPLIAISNDLHFFHGDEVLSSSTISPINERTIIKSSHLHQHGE